MGVLGNTGASPLNNFVVLDLGLNRMFPSGTFFLHQYLMLHGDRLRRRAFLGVRRYGDRFPAWHPLAHDNNHPGSHLPLALEALPHPEIYRASKFFGLTAERDSDGESKHSVMLPKDFATHSGVVRHYRGCDL